MVGGPERATPRSERRRFLAGQAESVHRAAGATSAASPAAAGPRSPNAEEQRDFEQMRREVHTYGAAPALKLPREGTLQVRAVCGCTGLQPLISR